MLPHSSLNRRSFLAACGAWGVGTAIAGEQPTTPSLADAIRTSLLDEVPGFFKSGALMCVIADPHILLGNDYPKLRTERWDDALIAEINSLSSLFTDLCVAGDLITHHTMNPGIPRYPVNEAWAREEFKLAKQQLERFSPSIRRWPIPGNHDTSADEASAELWQEMLGLPPYRLANLGGVPVFFLNTGNGGMPGPGQLAWFKGECAAIDPSQEIVIATHHPVFFALREEAAFKRVLCNLLGGRSGRVWIVSGHGHRFEDRTYSHRGTLFTQMEVTSANPKMGDDKLAPGYAMLAMHDGKVVRRMFRSLVAPGFTNQPNQTRGIPGGVEFQFDSLPAPIETYEHGVDATTGRIISCQGVDVGSYITYCKQLVLRIAPATYRVPPAALVLAGTVESSLNPSCEFSINGATGPWIPANFPANRGRGLFSIAIPEALRGAREIHIRVATGLNTNLAGFNLTGWAVCPDESQLTGYRRWLARQYGNLIAQSASQPDAITPGASTVNLLTYAFGLAPQGAATTPQPVLGGMPRFDRAERDVLDFRFARRRNQRISGVVCTIEESTDLSNWTPMDAAVIQTRDLDNTWEEAHVSTVQSPGKPRFLRASVALHDGAATGFANWRKNLANAQGGPPDANRNGVKDLLEYAFDLAPATPNRVYEPAVGARQTGMPHVSVRRGSVQRLVYTRPMASANPGVTCVIQSSKDLVNWAPVADSLVQENVLRSQGEWEEVEAVFVHGLPPRTFFRISVMEETQAKP